MSQFRPVSGGVKEPREIRVYAGQKLSAVAERVGQVRAGLPYVGSFGRGLVELAGFDGLPAG
jgi:hypothetical protein